MARAASLNVYVTPAGFYNAAVAAPNQKAALKAWEARADLFAEKLAQAETDEEWRKLALASPGDVLKRPRGGAAELLARPKPSKPPKLKNPNSSGAEAKLKPAPRPAADRTKLNDAEAALAKARLDEEQVRAEFSRRRTELERADRSATGRAKAAVDEAEAVCKREASAFARASR